MFNSQPSLSLLRPRRNAAQLLAGILAAALLAAAIFSVFVRYAGAAPCSAEDPYSALRLHIIADDDSEEAQDAKLAVRDAALACVREKFTEVSSEEDAEEALKSLGAELEAAAKNVLVSRGMDDNVQLMLGDFDFPDREYGDKLYPAGSYRALRIVLGSGEGRNWWCVMFPPLCVINCGEEAVKEDGTLEFRSFFAELWQRIFG